MGDMRVAVLSDSHGDRAAMARALDRMGPADAIFHLGDGGREVELAYDYACTIGIENLPLAGEGPPSAREVPVYVARGNCDFVSPKPLDGLAVLGKWRIYYCHGHDLQVKSGLDLLAERARQMSAHIALFGHTHIRCARYQNGVLLLNPGGLSRGRTLQKSGFALLDITDDGFRHTFVDLS